MTFVVSDSFEIRAGMPRVKHPPGVVVVFDAGGHTREMAKVGSVIHLARPDGDGIDVVVGDVKKHGSARSFYFEGLRLIDAPVGSKLSWDAPKPTSKRARRPRVTR
jgi:hypothetical protein